MKRPIEKPDPTYLSQLPLDLTIDDEGEAVRESNGFVTPDEARLRSETARQVLESGRQTAEGTSPSWMERYQELRRLGWHWRVACYIAWAASPRVGRWPKNQEELAKQVLGLTSDRQIGTWRQKNPAIDEVVTLLQAAPLFEHRADAFAALIKSATSADYKSHQDRKLMFEMLGDYVPRLRVDQRDVREVENLDDLSDEELDKLAKLVKRERPSANEASDEPD